MRRWSLRAVFACVLSLWLAAPVIQAREGEAVDAVASERALREMFGAERESWSLVPELVILTSVMDFTGSDMSAGYRATGATLDAAEIAQLEADLTQALDALTGGRITAFSAVRLEAVPAGQVAPMFRRGQVVVGQFERVRARSGSLGFGGRTVRKGAITAGAVVLDRDFGLDSERRLMLRTHELGHALGFNHVESQRSVMNPRVGATLTDFDRAAIEFAFLAEPSAPLLQTANRQN